MCTKVAKTAKSGLRFCLFVILLFFLPQLVSIRNKDLRTQNLTTLTITSNPDTPVISAHGGTSQALDSGFRQTTTTPLSAAILWVSWFTKFSPGDNRILVDTAGRYYRPIAAAYPIWHNCQSPPTVSRRLSSRFSSGPSHRPRPAITIIGHFSNKFKW